MHRLRFLRTPAVSGEAVEEWEIGGDTVPDG
jgi:hypothetical protein